MTTFALIHGSGDGGWAWHLVQRALRARGYDAVAPDLPTDRDDATWEDCVAAVVDAVGGAGRTGDVVVVGQSAGGFLVPLVADRVDALAQVYVAGMVPQAGETAGGWFENVGWAEAMAAVRCAGEDETTRGSDPASMFYHDVPAGLADEAMARERPVSEALAGVPWPGSELPAIATRYVVTTRDRFIPPPLQRHVAALRLAVSRPDSIDTGHSPNLSRPEELADILVGCVPLPSRRDVRRGWVS